MFLLNDVLERSDTIKKIMKLNLSDPMLYKREDTIDIGSKVQTIINIKRKHSFKILQRCIFLSSLVTQMLEKSLKKSSGQVFILSGFNNIS